MEPAPESTQVMSLPKAGVELVADNLSGYMASLNQAEGAMTKFGASADTSGKGINAFGQVATGALRQVGSIAVDALGNAAMAVGGFVKDSIDKAGDFEQGMLNFQSVAGKSVDTAGIEQFRDLFISLGKELPVSTSEVQAAATELVKGGIDPATIAAGGLRQSLQFAAASGLSLEQAATIAAKAVGGWVSPFASAEEKASFLVSSTDLLTKAANASTVNVDELALGLYNVQGTAKLAGVSFDETVTALAQLAPSFSSSADAGTSFKTFLTRLQPSTDPATAAMKELGLYTAETGSVFYDAQGNFVGMSTASELLKNATSGLTEAQKVSYLQTIFGQDAIRTAAVLAQDGAAGYDAMAASLANQNGIAETAATKQAGFNTSLDNTMGSVEALQITLGSALLPVLSYLLDSVLAPGINTVTTLADAVMGNDAAFGTLSPTLQTVATSIQGAWTQAQALYAAIEPMIPQIGATLIPVLASVAALLGGAVVFAVGSAVASFLIAAAPIFALIAVGALLYQAWQSNFGGVQQIVQSVMAQVQQVIGAGLAIVTRFWTENGTKIQAQATQAFNQAKTIITNVMQIIGTVVGAVLANLATFWRNNGDTIVAYLSAAWQVISGVFTTALNLISGITTTVLALLKGDWAGAGTAIMNTVKTLWADVQNVFDGAGKMINGSVTLLIAGVKQLFGGLATDAVKLGGNIISGIVQGVKDGVGSLMSAVQGAAQSALDAAKAALGIKSPSRLFADQVGEMIPAGIKLGIDANTGPLLQTMAGLSGQLAATVRPTATPGQIMGGLGQTTTTNNSSAINLTANYAYQPERRLVDDVARLSMSLGRG